LGFALIVAAESSIDIGEVGENGRHFSAGIVSCLFAEVGRQIVDQRAEEETVEVLAQHTDQVVITQAESADEDIGGGWRRRRFWSAVRETAEGDEAHLPWCALGYSVDYGQPRQDRQNDEPEPEEDVHFLVDDVQRQNAQGVVLLDCAWRSVLHKRTLGHPREHLDHGIVAVLLVHIGEVNDARAELEEGAVEEPIDKENVTHSVDKVEQLTREVGDDEARVGVERLGQILGYSSWSGFAFFVVVDHVKSAVALGHVAQFAVLPALPYPVRQVEEHTLKEEHERHPLIVAVHPLLSSVSGPTPG